MERTHNITGYCPVKNREISVAVTYISNFNCWEKGISEPPCSSVCDDGCPILKSAPDKISSL